MGRPRKVKVEPVEEVKESPKPIEVESIKKVEVKTVFQTNDGKHFSKQLVGTSAAEEAKENLNKIAQEIEAKRVADEAKVLEESRVKELQRQKEDEIRSEATKSAREECVRRWSNRKESVLYKVKTGATIGVEKIALAMGGLMGSLGLIYLFKDRIDSLVLLAIVSIVVAVMFMLYGWMVRDIQMQEIKSQLDAYWVESGVGSI